MMESKGKTNLSCYIRQFFNGNQIVDQTYIPSLTGFNLLLYEWRLRRICKDNVDNKSERNKSKNEYKIP